MQNKKSEVEDIVIAKEGLVPICEKYTLTIKEAAAYFNIGIKKMRRWQRKIRADFLCSAVINI